MVKTHPMWNNIPNIQAPLVECLELIIDKTVIDLIEGKGNLLRTAYFLLFSQLGNANKDAHKKIIAVAASTGVLHLATLSHDDIIDESTMRRGSETVQSKYGKDVAVYTRDLLSSVYYDFLADATDSIDIIQLNTLSTTIINSIIIRSCSLLPSS